MKRCEPKNFQEKRRHFLLGLNTASVHGQRELLLLLAARGWACAIRLFAVFLLGLLASFRHFRRNASLKTGSVFDEPLPESVYLKGHDKPKEEAKPDSSV